MIAVAKNDAVQKLLSKIRGLDYDDLVEVYNELFPDAPRSRKLGGTDGPELSAAIMRHVNQGLEIEEIIDLWNVIFPESHDVRYDDEQDAVCYSDEPDQTGMAP